MAQKIARVDNEVMNSLYGVEFAKLAGGKADWQAENGAPHGDDAFRDHADYLSTLKSVLSADDSSEGDENDPLKD